MRQQETSSADPRRKREAREVHKQSQVTQKMVGHKAKMHHAKRHAEKIQMKKKLKAHDERNVKQKDDGAVKEGALPAYLLDREGQKVGYRCMYVLTRAGRQGPLDGHQGPQERQGGKVLCAPAKGPRYCGGGDVQGPQDGQAQEQELEAHGQQGDLCRRGLHPQACQARGGCRGCDDELVLTLQRFVRPMALRMTKANVTHRELSPFCSNQLH